MMSYEEAVQVLEEMRSRYHAGFSSRDKEVIERLYETLSLIHISEPTRR